MLNRLFGSKKTTVDFTVFCFLIFLLILPTISICALVIRKWEIYYEGIVDCGIYIAFTILLLIIFLIKTNPSFRQNVILRLNFLDLLIIIWIGQKLFVHFAQGNTYNDMIMKDLVAIPYYFSLRYFLANVNNPLTLVFYAIAIGGLIECGFSTLQLLEVIQSRNGNFPITGSFFNPAPLSIFLSVSVFYLLYFLKNTTTLAPKAILIAIIVMVIAIVIIGNSRTAWISCMVSLLFFYRDKIDIAKFIKNRGRLLLLIASGTVLISILFLLRIDSAMGRLYVWKIALDMWLDNPIFGLGVSGFERNFGSYLITFFEQNNSDDAIMILGKVEYVFNEYIQILVEQGLIGFVIFIVVVGFCFTNNVSEAENLKSKIIKSSLLCFMVACFSSYPLRVFPLFILFITILAMVSHELRHDRKVKVNYYALSCILIGLALFGVFRLSFLYRAKQASFHGNENYLKGNYRLAEVYFQDALPHLYYDHNMMMPYAKSLYFNQKFTESLTITNLMGKNHSDTFFHIIRGDNYKELNAFNQAEKEYKLAIGMDPKLMYPKYNLAKLYVAKRDLVSAKKVAEEIMNMPIKVRSRAVEEMQTEMLELLYEP